MIAFSATFSHCFGDDMSKNPNRAREQAQRNWMPGFNLILKSIQKNMPGFIYIYVNTMNVKTS